MPANGRRDLIQRLKVNVNSVQLVGYYTGTELYVQMHSCTHPLKV